MKFQINFGKKHFYALIAVLAVFTGLVYVIAQGSVTAPNPGHTAEQIQFDGSRNLQEVINENFVHFRDKIQALETAIQALETPSVPIGTLNKTTAQYKGNLGGFNGADQKCQGEFGPGWRFARATISPDPESPSALSGATATVESPLGVYVFKECHSSSSIGDAWIGFLGGNRRYDCDLWLNTGEGDPGSLGNIGGTYVSGSNCKITQDALSGALCNQFKKLLCVKVS